jgi:hypothetical protein
MVAPLAPLAVRAVSTLAQWPEALATRSGALLARGVVWLTDGFCSIVREPYERATIGVRWLDDESIGPSYLSPTIELSNP